MYVGGQPILAQPSQVGAEDAGRQMRLPYPGEDHEPPVVDHAEQVARAGLGIPADEAITRPVVKDRSAPDQERDEFLAQKCGVADRLADRLLVAKVVVPPQVQPEAIALLLRDGAHNERARRLAFNHAGNRAQFVEQSGALAQQRQMSQRFVRGPRKAHEAARRSASQPDAAPGNRQFAIGAAPAKLQAGLSRDLRQRGIAVTTDNFLELGEFSGGDPPLPEDRCVLPDCRCHDRNCGTTRTACLALTHSRPRNTSLMRGTLYERLRKCGRKTCACARDPKARHRSHFLSVFLDGRTRGMHVRPVDVERVRNAVAAYERLWEIVNGLTACEVADLRREARERQRARKKARNDGA
ncbi:MAG: hypothetical protein HY901_29485 [Deltaproteobacteria bacterium]|nr:hypothetical protein [Deltaproteobacteria bacterium]